MCPKIPVHVDISGVVCCIFVKFVCNYDKNQQTNFGINPYRAKAKATPRSRDSFSSIAFLLFEIYLTEYTMILSSACL